MFRSIANSCAYSLAMENDALDYSQCHNCTAETVHRTRDGNHFFDCRTVFLWWPVMPLQPLQPLADETIHLYRNCSDQSHWRYYCPSMGTQCLHNCQPPRHWLLHPISYTIHSNDFYRHSAVCWRPLHHHSALNFSDYCHRSLVHPNRSHYCFESANVYRAPMSNHHLTCTSNWRLWHCCTGHLFAGATNGNWCRWCWSAVVYDRMDRCRTASSHLSRCDRRATTMLSGILAFSHIHWRRRSRICWCWMSRFQDVHEFTHFTWHRISCLFGSNYFVLESSMDQRIRY